MKTILLIALLALSGLAIVSALALSGTLMDRCRGAFSRRCSPPPPLSP
jgi:hypothetical protein